MTIADHQKALEPVVERLKQAGFWAYGTFDDENRWCVACDLAEGHVDVRIGLDGYEVDVWATLTGMFVDEENTRRRHALERLARISIPGIQRGYLAPNEKLTWDPVERGIALRRTREIPFSALDALPELITNELEHVTQTLIFLSRRIND